MPEGPEIRLAADRIGRALAGRDTSRVVFAFPRLARHQRALSGRAVRAVDARGKAMLIRFEGGLVVYSHNQLYGRWYLVRAGTLPRTRRSLRLAIHNHAHSALLYSASDIAVLREDQLDTHPYLARLGPDPLDRALHSSALLRRVRDPRFARRRLAALLLDQGFVAGIGNYLRSEILFVAGLHPERRLGDLDAAEQRQLARELRRVPRLSYQHRGVTNDVERARRLKARGLPRREYRHHVFARGGRPCWRCGTAIERRTLAGRQLFVCPTCQPAPRR